MNKESKTRDRKTTIREISNVIRSNRKPTITATIIVIVIIVILILIMKILAIKKIIVIKITITVITKITVVLKLMKMVVHSHNP